MARHSGKNAKVKAGSNFIGGIDGFEITEEVGDTDLTAAGDTFETHDTLFARWTLNIDLKLDHSDTGQGLRAGDSVAFEGYTEGDGTGKKYLAGTASVLSHTVTTSKDGATVRRYQCKGNGALSIEAVGA
jgi:hypothetical protein